MKMSCIRRLGLKSTTSNWTGRLRSRNRIFRFGDRTRALNTHLWPTDHYDRKIFNTGAGAMKFIILILIAMGGNTKTLKDSSHVPTGFKTDTLPQRQIDSLIQVSLKRMRKFGLEDGDTAIVIIARINKLYLVRSDGEVIRSYDVSTSRFGVGSEAGSYKTPPGMHMICEKIGEGQPLGMIFKGRKPTGKIAKIERRPVNLPKDYITSRILRLEGLEEGVNKGPGIDSKERFIYIHGTAEEGLIGLSTSFGCIRMRNKDVIELFEMVRESTLVDIVP